MAGKGTLTVRILGDASGFQKSLGSAQKSLGKLSKVAGGAAAALGTAVVGGVALSIKSFADFDRAMTESTAIMGDVTDAMRKDMASAAREVAKTTKFSATQAAESYFYLASAGMDAAASIEALPKVAAFAQAGNFDMALATDLLTDAQSALGLAVDDTAQNMKNMTRVSDVLVKANTAANATVEQFSEALTQKAGTALRQLNKDVEEGVAVLSVYADAGVKGSQAGVQLNAVLEGLTRTARLEAEAYAELGVAVFDSSGEMRHMADIVADLEGALGGMSTEQQLAALAALGLTRQARDGTVALLGTSDAIREYDDGLRNAAGFTEQVADKQMETFWAKLGIVKDQLLDVALSVGQTLMPALEGFADWLQAKLPSITGWFDRVSEKFTDLLDNTESSVGDSIVAMDSYTAAAKRLEGDTDKSLEETVEHWDSFTNMARMRTGEVVSYLSDIPVALDSVEQAARRDLKAAGGSITSFKEGAEEDMEEAGDLMGRLAEAWKTIWEDDIKPWLMDTVLPWITDTFVPGLASALWDGGKAAGKELARGVWEGLILGNAEESSQKVALFAARVTYALKNAFEIRSPSKLMADEVGLPIAQGVAEGILAGTVPIEEAMKEVLEKARTEAMDGLDAILGGIGIFNGRSGAQRGLAEAEEELNAALERQATIGAELVKARAERAAARRESKKVTEEEELAILQANERVIRAEQALADAREEGEATAAELRIMELQVAEAQRALTKVEEDAVGPTRALEEAEQRLADLYEERDGLTDRVREAQEALEQAQLRAIDVERDLLESGADLISQGPAGMETFRKLAESAGITSDAVDKLIAKYQRLIDAIKRAAQASSAQVPSPSSGGGNVVTVKPGDTLSAIARRHGTTAGRLAELNNISNPNLIHPGQRITVNATINMPPGSDGDDVVRALQRYERTNGPVPVKVRG